MQKLKARERHLIIAATVGIGCITLWSVIVAPAVSSREDSFAQLRKIDVLWAVLDRLPEGVHRQTPDTTAPLRQRVTASARSADIDIRRLDPQGSLLSVSLDAVPFTALIGWLDTLTSRSGVRVRSAEIGRRPEPGIVTARIVMEDAP
ncbi:type II secretion system protein M [uncultured Tateyamaria sp.]|uniref:type II secretion system protein M n=1 Tax=Tateyamaria sp. 1078 TaxID=3417464 RepID=UPI00261BC530|nr:type II secretion system protein M [uncultured Tateyamaria sp.]